MTTLDGSDEPLFADDLDDYYSGDEEPPPLPPPVLPRSASATSRDQDVDMGLRVGLESQIHSSQHDGQEDEVLETGRRRIRGQEDDQGETGEVQKPKKPILTFKMDRLFSEKGFPYVVSEFPKLKFQGKGHEVSDLKLLMQQYEQWANRLYPKLTFHDFTNRVETMARKNEFKSQLNLIRRKAVGVEDPEHEELLEDEDEERTEQIDDDSGNSTNENEGLQMEGTLTNENEENLQVEGTLTNENEENLQMEGTLTNENSSANYQLNRKEGPSGSNPPELWDIIENPVKDHDPYEDIVDHLDDLEYT